MGKTENNETGARGLCFFVEVVYNKIAVTLCLLVCFVQQLTKKWQYLECFLEPYWVCR